MRFPVFPLNGAILFPGTNLPLNIFEKKYIEMVDYALSNNRLIGMIQTNKNKDFFDIGCLGKITNFTETADGRYQINLEGLDRFKFNKIIKTDYKFITIEGDIVILREDLKIKNGILNQRMLSSFKNYLNTKKIDFDTSEFEGLDSSSLAKIICVISPLDYLVKQMLLEFDSENELCKNLLSVLEIEMKNTEKNQRVN
jgi:Lon protease-like protein